MLYRIKNWNSYFENKESRKLIKLRWFPCPNKFDGLTFRKITKQKNASELFAAWILLLEIASKSDPRGLLGKSTNAPGYSPSDMGLMTGFPVKIFEDSINFFSDNEIGWIETISPDVSGKSPDVSGKSPSEGIEGIEGNGREGSIGFARAPNVFKDNEILKRQKEFRTLIFEFMDYRPQMLEKFFEYWTEPNKSKTRMRFEMEKTWDLGRRLNTWASREKEFVKAPAENTVRKSSIDCPVQKLENGSSYICELKAGHVGDHVFIELSDKAEVNNLLEAIGAKAARGGDPKRVGDILGGK